MADRTDDIDDAVVDAEVIDDQDVAADAAGADDAQAAEAGAAPEADDPAAAVRAELDERTADLQRVSAEFANYRRRVDREREADCLSARASVAAELLNLADDVDRAEQHGDLGDGTPLRHFADKLRQTLASLKVEAFGEEGEPFDPDVHEAVQDMSSGDDKALGAVLRKGYRMDGRLLRTAMVVIADAPQAGDEGADAPES
ncbi:nucleotide exchange factor GrpE [Corynebacterium sp. 335C]